MKSRLLALSAPCGKRNLDARQLPSPSLDASGVSIRRSFRRHFIALGLAGAIGALGLANPAYADGGIRARTLYSTSFEQPKFLGGEQLGGLDGWSTPLPSETFPNLNPMAAKITGAASRRGEQSIEVRGAALTGDAKLVPYDAVGSYRRALNYSVSSPKRVRIEADLLLDTNQPNTKLDFISMNIAAVSGDGETIGEIGLSSDGKVAAFQPPIVPGDRPDNAFLKDTAVNRWHRVAIVLDYSNQETSYLSYFVDGQPLGTTTFATTNFNELSRASMVVYAYPDGDEKRGGPGSLRSNYTARFDNFKVSVGGDASDRMLSAEDEKD